MDELTAAIQETKYYALIDETRLIALAGVNGSDAYSLAGYPIDTAEPSVNDGWRWDGDVWDLVPLYSRAEVDALFADLGGSLDIDFADLTGSIALGQIPVGLISLDRLASAVYTQAQVDTLFGALAFGDIDGDITYDQLPAAGGTWNINGGTLAVSGTVTATSFSGGLNADDLTSGTIPDARFPATLPAVSGVNLTALNASNITAGNLAYARLPTGSSDTWDTGVGTTLTITRNLTVSGTLTATLAGNAASASVLTPGRQINGVAFDGSADITVTAASNTLTGTTLAANVVNTSITSVGTLTSLAVTGTITGASTLRVGPVAMTAGMTAEFIGTGANASSQTLVSIRHTGSLGNWASVEPLSVFAALDFVSDDVTGIVGTRARIGAYMTSATGAATGLKFFVGPTSGLIEALQLANNRAATFARKVTVGASDTSLASFNVPVGVAPTSPVDNDVWATASSFLYRLSSVTYHGVLATASTKVTSGAPYANDGYVVMRIDGTDRKFMTTA